jgi:hypothetical protein
MSCRPGLPRCRGWRGSARDGSIAAGRTGPELAEETCSTSPTSWRCPMRARGRRTYPFRGFRRPLSRGAVCRPYVSGLHSVTELTPAFPHRSPTVPGMASRGGLAEHRRDMIHRWCQRAGVARIRFWPGHPRRARAFNALVGGVGAGVASSGRPRARRRITRGGV